MNCRVSKEHVTDSGKDISCLFGSSGAASLTGNCDADTSRVIAALKTLFHSFNERLREEALADAAALGAGETQIVWLRRMHMHTTAGGKMNRGLAVLETAVLMGWRCPCALTDCTRDGASAVSKEALVALAWCIEWLQASFLVADDIMDRSETRRGLPCWYRVAGAIAINDAFVLQSMLQRTLRRYFCGETYVRLVDLFAEVRMRTEIGQLLDLLVAPSQNASDSGLASVPAIEHKEAIALQKPSDTTGVGARFTQQTYDSIVRLKTAHYSFRLPVAAAIVALGQQPACLPAAEDALLALGDFFQVQDDFLDCYGDPLTTGKVGTDIAEGKCTWLVTQALEALGSRAEREDFEEAYARGDETTVRAFYDRMGVREMFAAHEAKCEVSIRAAIAQIPDARLCAVVSSFAARIFRREK